MLHALSTRLFSDERLTVTTLDAIHAAEIPLIEIYCTHPHVDPRNRVQLSELSKWFLSSPMKVHSIHAPAHGSAGGVLTVTEPVKSVRKEMVDEIKRAMEIAESVPCRYWIQHMGAEGEAFNGRAVDAAYHALEELEKFARQRGVELLLENIPSGLIERDWSGCERLLKFMEMTRLDLNVCFDVGHAHMEEGLVAAFELLKDRIRTVHVHDNNGKADSHDLPFSGCIDGIDWGRSMTLLRAQGDRYPLLLEPKALSKMAQELAYPLDDVRRAFDELDDAKESDAAIEERARKEAREKEERG